MDNFNSFKPPVDASNGEPIFSTEATEEKTEQTEVTSEKFGPTSDENGYGTDSHGSSLTRDDADSSHYDKQVDQRVNEVYSAAEAEIQAENQTFEDEWNAEYAEKERNDKIHLAIVALRDTIKDANARIDEIETMIKEESEHAERILAERKASQATPEENTPNASADAATLSAAEASSDFTTAGSQPINSTESQDINASSAVAPNTDTSIPPQGTPLYQGKDDLVYSDRQQAIDSFKQ